MAVSGRFIVGSAWVQLKADATGLRTDIRTSVLRAATGVNARVGIRADSAGLRRDIQADVKRATTGIKANIPIDVDGRGVRAKVERAARGAKVKADVDVDVDRGGPLGRLFGRVFGQAFVHSPGLRSAMVTGIPTVLASPAGIAGLVVGGLFAAGFASALVSSVALGGIGAAFIGLGAIALKESERVKFAFGNMAEAVKSSLAEAAEPLKIPLALALEDFGARFATDIAPRLKPIFTALAPVLPAAVDAFVDAMVIFLDTLARPDVLDAIKLFMLDALPELVKLAPIVAEFFVEIAKVQPEVSEGFANMVLILGRVISVLDEVTIFFLRFFNGLVNVGTWLETNPITSKLVRPLGVLRTVIEFVGQNWRTVWEGAQSVFSTFANFFGSVWSATWRGAVDILIGFRDNVWTPTINALGTAVTFLNENVWQPFVGAIQLGLEILGAAVNLFVVAWQSAFQLAAGIVSLIWENVLRPIFTAIVVSVRDQIMPVITGFGAVVAVVFTAVRIAITTAWTFIRDNVFRPVVSWLTETLVGAFRTFLTTVTVIFNIFRNVVRTTWENVRNVIMAVWNFIRENVFIPIRDWVTRILVGAFITVRNQVSARWEELRSALASGWNWIRENVFERIRDWIGRVPGWFRSAVRGISRWWNGLPKRITDPVNRVMKALAQFLDKLGKIPGVGGIFKAAASGLRNFINPDRLATGGRVRGAGTSTSDSVPALLSNDEFVIRGAAANKVQRIYGRNALDSLNKFGVLPGDLALTMASGGSVNEIINFARKSGAPIRVTSTVRNTPDWHGRGQAVDFGGFNQHALARHFMSVGSNLRELIHSIGSSRGVGGYFIKNGQVVPPNFYGNEVGRHFNHLHVAAPPGFSGGGKSLFDKITGFFGGFIKRTFRPLGELAFNAIKGPFNAALSPLDNIPFGPAAKKAALSVPERILSFLDEKDPANAATAGLVGGSGSVMRQALRQAQAMQASKKVLLALFEAGFVESNFRNLGHQGPANDHDSLGFLQQRPSAGWGTPAQIMNVPFATRSFVGRATPIQGRFGTAGQLAQAVQVSAFPGRYDAAEGRARAALRALGVPGFFAGSGRLPGAGNQDIHAALLAPGERVLTESENARLELLAAQGRGAGGLTVEGDLHVTVPARDLKEMKDVTDFVERLKRDARYGERKIA